MSVISRLLGGVAPSGIRVADVFSVDIYTGNGSTQTITNGVNLSGEGGLVWTKSRDSGANHLLFDTERGVNMALSSDDTAQSVLYSNTLTGFNTDGFDLGSFSQVNGASISFVAWTFRKSPRFFDVVTYTGNGSVGRTIAHNLGSVPGMIIVKQTNSTGSWFVYHRGVAADPETDYLLLNRTDAAADSAIPWNDTAPTSASFTVGGSVDTNGSGSTYVAYIFAHDPSGIIQCGSYTGNGSTAGPVVTLGWEPQYLMIKRVDAIVGWRIYDSARSASNPRVLRLEPNSSGSEATGSGIDFNTSGFQIKDNRSDINASGATHVYLAIKAE